MSDELEIKDAELVDESNTSIIPKESLSLPASVVQQDTGLNDIYGYYAGGKSHLCPICQKSNHMEINLLRARDHLSYDEIARRLKSAAVTPSNLEKHFKNHYIVAERQRKLIALKEDNTSTADLALVNKIFEGEMDIFAATQAIMESKARRHVAVMNRIDFLKAHLEVDTADDIDKQEFIQLNKICCEIEDSMEKVVSLRDKKLFPPSQADLSNAILKWKLSIFSKLIDSLQFTLLKLERDPKYSLVVSEIRSELAKNLNPIEDEILRSGGIIGK
jgi:hypothetical protein